MSQTILYIAMSLDGYIADINGGVSWLSGQDINDQNPGSYPDFLETIDTIIMGSKTYEQIITELSPQVWVYKGKKTYVVTYKTPSLERPEVKFTKESIDDVIRKLKDQPGKDIWICGGASIVNQLLKADLIDSFRITIIPTLLGDGIRLFEKFGSEKKLTLVDTLTYNGMVELIYRRRDV